MKAKSKRAKARGRVLKERDFRSMDRLLEAKATSSMKTPKGHGCQKDTPMPHRSEQHFYTALSLSTLCGE
jgi:hypothetical protein